LACNLLHGLV